MSKQTKDLCATQQKRAKKGLLFNTAQAAGPVQDQHRLHSPQAEALTQQSHAPAAPLGHAAEVAENHTTGFKV